MWLIRTAAVSGHSEIRGPMDTESLKELILNGRLRGKDEICSGTPNGTDYWFTIEDAAELERQLGIVPPRSALRPGESAQISDEETQTDTELLSEPPIPDLPEIEHSPDAKAESATRVVPIATLSQKISRIGGGLQKIHVIRSMERTSAWKVAGFILAGVVLGLLLMMLKILA